MRTISPNARSELLQQLDTALYQKARTSLHYRLCELITANSKQHGNAQMMFTFREKTYCMRPHVGKYPPVINLLHRDLRPQFKAWLADQEALETERRLALGYVQRIMTVTDRIADYYRLLPDALAPVLRKLDRFFVQGEGKLSARDAQAFIAENEKYILQMKIRMTYNLLDAS